MKFDASWSALVETRRGHLRFPRRGRLDSTRGFTRVHSAGCVRNAVRCCRQRLFRLPITKSVSVIREVAFQKALLRVSN